MSTQRLMLYFDCSTSVASAPWATRVSATWITSTDSHPRPHQASCASPIQSFGSMVGVLLLASAPLVTRRLCIKRASATWITSKDNHPRPHQARCPILIQSHPDSTRKTKLELYSLGHASLHQTCFPCRIKRHCGCVTAGLCSIGHTSLVHQTCFSYMDNFERQSSSATSSTLSHPDSIPSRFN